MHSHPSLSPICRPVVNLLTLVSLLMICEERYLPFLILLLVLVNLLRLVFLSAQVQDQKVYLVELSDPHKN